MTWMGVEGGQYKVDLLDFSFSLCIKKTKQKQKNQKMVAAEE